MGSIRYIDFPIMEEALYQRLIELGAKYVLQQAGEIVGAIFPETEQAQQAIEIAADDFDRTFLLSGKTIHNLWGA